MSNDRFQPIKQPNEIKSYFKNQRFSILAVAVTGSLFNGFMFLGPVFQGKLIDSIVAKEDLREVFLKVGLFIGTILIIQLLRFIKRYYVRLFANNTSKSMRLMIYNNIIHKSMEELSQEKTGDLLNKAIADVDICAEGMRKVTTEIFDTGVLMLGYLVSMFVYDIKITIIAAFFLPVAMWIAEKLKKKIVSYSKEARMMASKLSNTAYNNVEQTILMRVHGLEQSRKQAFEKEVLNLERKQIKAVIVGQTMLPLYQLIAMLGAGFVVYLCGKRVIVGDWSVGMFSAYLTIFAAVTLKVSKAANLFNAYQKAKVSWKRIKPYLIDYQVEEETDIICTDIKELCVRKVSYQYENSDQKMIENLSFELKSGQMLGVTGQIASGKSTLGAILCGLLPYEGSIQLNQRELSSYTKIQKSNRISYMPHETDLLSDTIYHNITLGIDGDITQVLKDVCFKEDMKSMPDGIQTMVGNHGVRLSGGQQARIALARALYHKADLLVLDDPFAAVDKKTEQQIIQNLQKNYQDRMIVILSHRLAIFPELDQIIVLLEDHTAIIGSHEQLMKSSRIYRTLYELQQGGENREA
ncbi:MAG: ABC transporter ATP-binding protein [Clostridiales bacterium]|nr:ABC transporter ATP-binding protein [Clostridiales bacterium]